VGPEAFALLGVEGGQQAGLRSLEAVIESRQEFGALLGGDDATGAPVSRIGAALDQAGSFQVVEQVGHDRAVDSEVLRKCELTANRAVCGSGEHLIAAGTAGQVSDRVERGRDVGPEDRPESPSKIVCERSAAAVDRHCAVSVLNDIAHGVIVTVSRKKVLQDDVL
jgi:hypothetical protein